MRIEWIADVRSFGELASAWDELALREPTPFLQPAWLLAWWAAFGRDEQLRICTVWDGDALTGALPMYARRGGLHGLANIHCRRSGRSRATPPRCTGSSRR